MSPIEIDEQHDPIGPHLDDSGRRASLKGFLSVSMEKYLELLDWTGRQIRSDKIGAIPEHLQPILTVTDLARIAFYRLFLPNCCRSHGLF